MPAPKLLLASALAALAAGLAPAQAQERGLATHAAQLTSPQWQARIERDGALLAHRANTPLWLLGTTQRHLRLLGDYQFSTWRLGDTGGLRLTGGVLLQQRPGLPGADSASAQLASGIGYAGVGYSAGHSRDGWGFSADLGINALGFGQHTGASSGLALRDSRLSPTLRLGVNLAF